MRAPGQPGRSLPLRDAGKAPAIRVPRVDAAGVEFKRDITEPQPRLQFDAVQLRDALLLGVRVGQRVGIGEIADFDIEGGQGDEQAAVLRGVLDTVLELLAFPGFKGRSRNIVNAHHGLEGFGVAHVGRQAQIAFIQKARAETGGLVILFAAAVIGADRVAAQAEGEAPALDAQVIVEIDAQVARGRRRIVHPGGGHGGAAGKARGPWICGVYPEPIAEHPVGAARGAIEAQGVQIGDVPVGFDILILQAQHDVVIDRAGGEARPRSRVDGPLFGSPIGGVEAARRQAAAIQCAIGVVDVAVAARKGDPGLSVVG